MSEQRKTIPGHRQYEVDNKGNVYRIAGGRKPESIITSSIQLIKGRETGYIYVTLLTKDATADDGETYDFMASTRVSVHRLVCRAFHGEPPHGKPCVNHIDGIKGNNSPDNLKWTSISENIKHKYDTGQYRTPTGKDSPNFGLKRSKAVRKLMSLKKQGDKHPKFKGHFTFKNKRYTSARQASIATGQNQKTIARYASLKTNGWGFIPKQDTTETQP
jgi:hypothetical protein